MDNILPAYVAFFGPLIFIVVFEFVNWNKLNIAAKISLPFLIYVSSVAIGATSGAVFGRSNVNSAQIAGVYAPLAITSVLTLIFFAGSPKLLRFFRKRNEDWNPDEDDFLDDFDH